jgi:hypothetical protein
MRLISSSSLLVAISTFATSAFAKESSEVVELSDKSFSDFITANNVALIEYFAPCTIFGLRCK